MTAMTINQIRSGTQPVSQQHQPMLSDLVRHTNTSLTYSPESIPIKKKQLLKFLDELLEAARTEEVSEEWNNFEEELKQDHLRFGYSEDV